MFDIIDFIKEADGINTSRRRDALDEEIMRLPDISDEKHGWRRSVYSGLTHRIFYEYNRLKEAHERNDDELAIVAWHARNLLELLIWSLFCTTNDDNARQFYEDAGRDYYDLLEKYKIWGDKTNLGCIWQSKFENSQEELNELAMKHQVLDLKSKYLSASETAKSLGMKNHFDMANKAFSKFAHPTAGYVVLPLINENAKKLKTAFFGQGCVSFLNGFKCLEQHLCK